jgi:AcrR family transcriptional regulator
MAVAKKGISEKSRTKQAEIIRCALEVFVQEGYAAVTLRRVADELGISKGNLSYHFPNKNLLLGAVVEDFLRRYEEAHENVISSFGSDVPGRMRSYLSFLVRDAQDTHSQGFFFQLWSMSSYRKDIARYKDRVYEHFLAQLRIELSLARPDLSKVVQIRKAFTIMSLLEGSNVLFSTSGKYLKQFGKMDDFLLEELLAIVFGQKA